MQIGRIIENFDNLTKDISQNTPKLRVSHVYGDTVPFLAYKFWTLNYHTRNTRPATTVALSHTKEEKRISKQAEHEHNNGYGRMMSIYRNVDLWPNSDTPGLRMGDDIPQLRRGVSLVIPKQPHMMRQIRLRIESDIE